MSSYDTDSMLPLENAAQRQLIYRLIAMLYLYPTNERLDYIVSAGKELRSHPEILSGIAVSVLGNMLGLFDRLEKAKDRVASNLEEEHVNLFSAKPKAPAHEAVYVDPEGFARGWIMVKLEKEYADAGMELTQTFKDQPDHITVELEFMAHLCRHEAQAETEKDLHHIHRRQLLFLKEHLWNWFPAFSNRLQERAPSSFYSLLTEVTLSFLHSELRRISQNHC